MILFDIGAHTGTFTKVALEHGYKVIAVEAAPRVYKDLVGNYIYNSNVVPLKFAVSDTNDQQIEFYECIEDGLSTTNLKWLTDPAMPYNGKAYRSIKATTITIDTLAKIYGEPDFIKIDVEGAEWAVLRGMTKYSGVISFEWTQETIKEHEAQLDYLYSLGYKEFAPQFIVQYLEEPKEWFKLKKNNKDILHKWRVNNEKSWTENDWKVANLRPTADVGMVWIK